MFEVYKLNLQNCNYTLENLFCVIIFQIISWTVLPVAHHVLRYLLHQLVVVSAILTSVGLSLTSSIHTHPQLQLFTTTNPTKSLDKIPHSY